MSKMSISGVVVEVGRKPDLPGVALRVKETVESEFGSLEIVHTVLCDVDDGVQVGEVVRGYGLVEWIPPGVIGSVSVPELKRPQQKPAGGYNRSSGNRQQTNRWNNRRNVPSGNSQGTQGGNRNYSQGQRSGDTYEQSREPRQSRPVEEIDPSQFRGQPSSGQTGAVRATDGDINLNDRHRQSQQPQRQPQQPPQPQQPQRQPQQPPQPQRQPQQPPQPPQQPQQQNNHDAQVLDREVERGDYGTEERCSHYEEVLPASSGSFKINTKSGW